MAPSADLARLDAAYRTRALSIMAVIALITRRRWASLTRDDLLSGGPALDEWLSAATQATISANRVLALDSVKFNRDVRTILGVKQPPIAITPPPPIEQVRTSLFVTGVVGARERLSRVGDPPLASPEIEARLLTLRSGVEQAEREAIAKSGDGAASAAARHAANGGRQQSISESSAALGYIRVTGPRPCYFCAMLATRGVLPDSGAFSVDSFHASDSRFEGPGTAKVHDNCSCHLRPVYTESSDEVPEENRRIAALWSGEWGGDLKDWRRYYDASMAAA